MVIRDKVTTALMLVQCTVFLHIILRSVQDPDPKGDEPELVEVKLNDDAGVGIPAEICER